MTFKGLIAPADNSLSRVKGTSTALQRVANRPIVCHVLEALRQAGITEIAMLASAAEAQELRACVESDGPGQLVLEYVPYAEGHFEDALRAASGLLGDAPCVVHAADGLLTQALTPLLGALEGDAHDLLALVHRQHAANGSVGLATRRILRLAGATHEERALELAGACLLREGVLSQALDARAWHGQGLDVAAIAERLGADGGRVGVEHVSGWRRNRGEVEDLLELNRIAFDAVPRERLVSDDDESDGGAQTNTIEGYVDIHPTARMHASVVVGPARVGPGAEVVDSYIGPYTSIGADVRIESAEVERSIIMPGASIVHIGGRLVGSVVGRDARIFRDFSLPRALRVNVGDGNEVALC